MKTTSLLDLVWIDRLLSQAICHSLQQQHDLKRDQVLICCSHTHTGPVVAGNLRPLHYLQLQSVQQAAIDRYLEELQQKISNVTSPSSPVISNNPLFSRAAGAKSSLHLSLVYFWQP